MSFSEIIGNRSIIQLVEKGVREGTLYPSIIFHGKEGIGKKLAALNVAKGFNCESKRDRPCDTCTICRKIDMHHHPDVRYILPSRLDERLKSEERKSLNVKIEQIREVVESISFRQYTGAKKVYIIDFAETLTEEAANALLKTLEEPPPYAVLILITPAFHSLLPTIRSRCWALPFNPIPPSDIQEFLIGKEKIDARDARILSVLCEGSIGKALREDLPTLIARGEKLMDLIEDAIEKKIPEVLRGANEISKNPDEFRQNLDMLSSIFRDTIVLQKTDDQSLLVNDNLSGRIGKIRDRLVPGALPLLEKVEEIKGLLAININKRLAMESLFFEIAR